MSRMTLNDAVGLLISTADARMQMWRGVAEGKSPDDLVDDLWDSCSTGPYDEARAINLEAERMAEDIEAAIDKVRVFRDYIL